MKVHVNAGSCSSTDTIVQKTPATPRRCALSRGVSPRVYPLGDRHRGRDAGGVFLHQPDHQFRLRADSEDAAAGTTLVYTQPGEAFSLYINVALMAGAVFASPFRFFQIWRLMRQRSISSQKRFAIPFVFLTTVGAAAALFQPLHRLSLHDRILRHDSAPLS